MFNGQPLRVANAPSARHDRTVTMSDLLIMVAGAIEDERDGIADFKTALLVRIVEELDA